MFSLSSEAIATQVLIKKLRNPHAGALATFEGWVRNHHEGRQVSSLTYEAYETLANSEADKIITEALAKFEVDDAIVVHRTGQLAIGDMAVWVGVTAAHRDGAFKACRYIIDEIKHRLPIWKYETYLDGNSAWVNCTHHHMSEPDIQAVSKELYYSRQVCLPELGIEGQETLANSRVLVIGAGGLGSPVLLYLAAAGVGTLGICDNDVLDFTNLHRQVLYRAHDVGKAKVALAAKRLQKLNPNIHIRTHVQRLLAENAELLLDQYDVILDCTDNFDAKFLIHEAGIRLGKALVHASIYRFEGQVVTYRPGQANGCLRCLWPKRPEQGCVDSCTDAGILGAIAGIVGSIQALETIKILLNLPDALPGGTLATIDLNSFAIQKINIPKLSECSTCNLDHTAFSQSNFVQNSKYHPIEITITSAQELASYQLIDITQSLPETFESSEKYLLVCQHGIRSRQQVMSLRKQGIQNVYSLSGGSSALKHILQKDNALCL